MSVQRLLKKKKKQEGEPVESLPVPEQTDAFSEKLMPSPMKNQRARVDTHFDAEKEAAYAQYADCLNYNPSNIEFSSKCMPYNLSLTERCRIPLSASISPINTDLSYTPRPGQKIPRCGSCRAYMNYYNEITKRGFKCFLCGRENITSEQIEENVECTLPSYTVDGVEQFYKETPPQTHFVFMIDISHDAFKSRMLEYGVCVIKNLLANEEYDDREVYIYTFDENIHEYEFYGDELKCTVIDMSIKEFWPVREDRRLSVIRNKLFDLLDSLEERSEKNRKNQSRFFQSLEYVFNATKQFGTKIFILQANENISSEPFLSETASSAQQKYKSPIEAKNKQFFQTYSGPCLINCVSFCFFFFHSSANFRNFKNMADLCKVTSSTCFAYSKEAPEDGLRFYYQFHRLLSAPVYTNVQFQMQACQGWNLTAVYGSCFRVKAPGIRFKMTHAALEDKVSLVFVPQGDPILPYFSLQVNTNYFFDRKHYLSVYTCVVPLTTSIDRLFLEKNYSLTNSTYLKSILSSLRIDDPVVYRQQLLRNLSDLWVQCKEFFGKNTIMAEAKSIFQSIFAILKSKHFQLAQIQGTVAEDQVSLERMQLLKLGIKQSACFLLPYLFNLQNIEPHQCQQENFEYPEMSEVKFAAVKDGIFLMDAGLALYLYFGRTYRPEICRALFGKDKFPKGQLPTEEIIQTQKSQQASQLCMLLRVLREQKYMGWTPLYIVQCGQNTLREKSFYLQFSEERYEEFGKYNVSFSEFIESLERP